jgi:hypothetical protein
LSKFGSKVSLKMLRAQNLSQRRGPWWFWSWMRGLDWVKLASRCLRTLGARSSEWHQPDKELWGCMLAEGWSEWEEEVFVGQTSVLDLLMSSSWTRTSPPVLLESGSDVPNDPPTVREEVPAA